MFVLTVIVTLAAAAVFAAAGAAKLQGARQQVRMADHLGYAWSRYRMIGLAELLGAAGLLLGLWVGWLGVLVALCLVVLTVGAMLSHSRAGDGGGQMAPAIGAGVLALVTLLLHALT